MLYFSDRALNEIDDARHTVSRESSAGVAARWMTATTETSVSLDVAGSMDRVDFALKRSRRRGRRVVRNLHSVTQRGCIVDIGVSELQVGVMPFAYFGDRGEGYRQKVRAFWAEVVLPARWRRAAGPCERVLIGSLDNVVNRAWMRDGEDSVLIGHDYPSEPSTLSRLVQAELDLCGAHVSQHVRDAEAFQPGGDGERARFASEQTDRADKTLVREPGYARSWRRRPALSRARVVAICDDFGPRRSTAPRRRCSRARAHSGPDVRAHREPRRAVGLSE